MTSIKENHICNKCIHKREFGGDTYLTSDFSNEFRIVFNEKSLGLFLKSTSDLVQISRGAIISSHEFLNKQ